MTSIVLSQKYASGESRYSTLINYGLKCDGLGPVSYHLYPRLSDNGQETIESYTETDISSRGLSSTQAFAVIRFWTVSLQIKSTKVHLHAYGWRPEDHSGIDLLKAPESSYSPTIFLRPHHVFQIGQVILQTKRRKGLDHEPIARLDGAVQAAPMANDKSQKRKRVKQESQDDITENGARAGAVTRSSRSSTRTEPVLEAGTNEATTKPSKSSALPEAATEDTTTRVSATSIAKIEPVTKRGKQKVATKKKTTERNPFEPVEPPLINPLESDECRESVLRDASRLSHNKTTVRVYFANLPSIGIESAPMRLLETKGLRTVDSIKPPHWANQLSRLLESAAKSQLLDHEYSLAARKNFGQGLECDIDLSETIDRARAGVTPLLGYLLFFTPAAINQIGIGQPFSQLESLALTADAKKIEAGLSQFESNGYHCADNNQKVILTGFGSDDEKVEDLVERSWKVFSLEILTMIALRGFVDTTNDEFILRPRLICGNYGALWKRGNEKYAGRRLEKMALMPPGD